MIEGVSGERRTAVVGAGIAGLAAAAILVQNGRAVTVFEKSRGTGGRLSTRRVDHWTFDHGTVALRVGDLDDELRKGKLAEWTARRLRLGLDGRPLMPKVVTRMVGVPGMSAVVATFVPPTSLRCGVRIDRLLRDGAAWRLADADGAEHGPFDEIVIALPAPQAAVLLSTTGEHDDTREFIERNLRYHPRWALLAGWRTPAVDLGWDLLEGMDDSLPIVVMSREATKPGRPPLEAIVVHAGVDWTLPRIDHEPRTVAPILLEEARSLVGPARWPKAAPDYLAAHRWRLAQPDTAAGTGCLRVVGDRVVLCGDWMVDGTVGGAKRSGMAAAWALIDP